MCVNGGQAIVSYGVRTCFRSFSRPRLIRPQHHSCRNSCARRRPTTKSWSIITVHSSTAELCRLPSITLITGRTATSTAMQTVRRSPPVRTSSLQWRRRHSSSCIACHQRYVLHHRVLLDQRQLQRRRRRQQLQPPVPRAWTGAFGAAFRHDM